MGQRRQVRNILHVSNMTNKNKTGVKFYLWLRLSTKLNITIGLPVGKNDVICGG